MDAPWCFAGDGLNSAFGSDNIHGVPGFEDAKHDIVLAIMNWVENGTAPDTLVATKYKDDDATEGVQRQRTLCPYPLVAQYIGSGNCNCTALY